MVSGADQGHCQMGDGASLLYKGTGAGPAIVFSYLDQID
jgi:hypothetical protein